VSITFNAVSHAYDREPVLEDVHLAVAEGEVLALLGPSGSGKSTLLKLAAGLEPLQAGVIELPGMRVEPGACPAPEARPTCLVFQQHALFPHLTVFENVTFGLAGVPRSERGSRVASLLEAAGLDGLEARYPHTLSGGQQQRVALVRALAPAPAVMLMDEPFASVDVLLARRLREESRLLLKESGATTLLVTHDPEDALALADRIAVIIAGRIVQVGTPAELWAAPGHPFIAEVFAGRQLLDAEWDGTIATTAFGEVRGLTAPPGAGTSIKLAVDPFTLNLSPDADSDLEVADIRFSGRHYLVLVHGQEGGEPLHVATREAPAVDRGDRVRVDFAPAGINTYN
jgi:iron(III) transport system ATP-binding protein